MPQLVSRFLQSCGRSIAPIFTVFCLFALSSVAWPTKAFAYPVVGMTDTVGYAGYYGKNHWVPVYLTIQNKGTAADGDLVVSLNEPLPGGRLADGVLRWPVHLPAKGWTHAEIAVPGSLIESGNSTVDCVVNGSVIASAFLGGNSLGNVALVAVLSSQPQDAQFLTGSTAGPSGNPVFAAAVNPATMPVQANLLNDLTAVAATPKALSQLTSAQSEALWTWVKLGGLLLVSGTGTSSPDWQTRFPIAPGPLRTVGGGKLASYVGNSNSVPKAIEISADVAQPGATIWAGNARNPLIAAESAGRGTIVQTSFWPNQPALLGWSGNIGLWTSILQQGNAGSESALPTLLDPTGVLSLSAASDALSPLRVPSLRFWIIIFALYTVISGPILFILLRRVKREPLAWAILPTLAVVTTLLIYGFGSRERPSGILTEGLGVVDLTGDGTAEALGIRGYMSPFLSSVQVKLPQPMLVLPMAGQNVSQLGDAMVWSGDTSDVSFVGVGRFGLRYLYTAGAVSNAGELQTRLWGSSANVLTGYVSNDTPYTLQNVALLWNGRMFQLGDIRQGQTVALNPDTPSVQAEGNWMSVYGAYNRDLLRGFGRPLAAWSAAQWATSGTTNSEAMIVATTGQATPGLPLLESRDKVSSSQLLSVVRQFAPVTEYAGGVQKS